MNKALFMLAELIGGFEERSWIFSGVAVLTIMIISILISVMITVTQPKATEVGPTLVITPASTVQSDVENLMFQLRQDPMVAGVNLNAGLSAEQIEVQLYPDVAAVTGRQELALLSGVEHVEIPPTPPAGTVKVFIQNPANVVLIIAGLFILLIGMLVAIYMALRSARTSFAADLEILEQVGIAPSLLRVPFALFGGLMGLCGAVLTAFVGYSMAVWLPSLAISETLFPELLRTGMIEQMAVGGVVIALLIGIVACLSMGFAIYRYPRPFSLSRSSSSSAAVRAG